MIFLLGDTAAERSNPRGAKACFSSKTKVANAALSLYLSSLQAVYNINIYLLANKLCIVLFKVPANNLDIPNPNPVRQNYISPGI